MAWSVLQFNFSNPAGPATIHTHAFGSNVTAGNLLIISNLDASQVTNGLTDTRGTVYAQAAHVTGASQPYIWYGIAGGTGACTVSITFNASVSFPNIWAYEVSGNAASSPFDVSATSSGTSSTVSTGTTPTTAVANEFLFAYMVPAGGITSGPGGIWTTNIDAGSSGCATEYAIAASTGTFSTTATASSNAAYEGLIAAFLPAAGAVVPVYAANPAIFYP